MNRGFRNRNVLSVELNRDGLNAPWGLRLKGGKDVEGGTPLEITRVAIGTAGEGVLHVGDRVVGIDHLDASQLTHADAQNIFRHAGTAIKLDIVRPSASQGQSINPIPPPSSFPHPTTSTVDAMDRGFQQHQQPQQQSYQPPMAPRQQQQQQLPPHLQRPIQPYRTTQLVFPGAKTVHDSAKNNGYDDGGYYQSPANTICQAISYQPFRTTPLVTPAPKTIIDVKTRLTQNEAVANATAPPLFKNTYQRQESMGGPHSKTISMGGMQKEVVSNQFNCPLNMYSDEAIAEAAMTNKHHSIGQGGHSQPSGSAAGAGQHPGFVPSGKSHLPTPKDPNFSRPQQSETFKLILESEMDKARNEQGIMGSEFHKPPGAGGSRPSSSMSNRSGQPNDPIMLDNSISQSKSFKILMHNVLGHEHE